MNHKFTFIHDEASLNEFLKKADYMHDALLREVGILSRGYVGENRLMYGDVDPYDVRLVFHSQSKETPCFEIICEEVYKFRFEIGFSLDPSGLIDGEKISLYFIEGTGRERFMVSARLMRYRLLSRDYLGGDPHTVSRINRFDG